MATYASLTKIARVTIPGDPSAVTYAITDQDGREMIAALFNVETSYLAGDYVIEPSTDALYRFTQNHSAGAWSGSDAELVTIGAELKRLAGIMAGGIHYRGKTITPLYDGATTNPINITGVGSYTAEAGDLVILTLDTTHFSNYYSSLQYQAIGAHTYFYDTVGTVTTYYYAPAAISAAENTSLAAIAGQVNIVSQNVEFLFDGTSWSVLGLVDNGLGDLAYKDSASGTYVKPTGSGTVSALDSISVSKQKLSTSTFTNGTADIDTAVANVAISDPTTATQTFTVAGITVSQNGDALVFSTASTSSIRGVTGSQSIVPAKAATSTITYATGSLETGDQLVSSATASPATLSVTVGTTTDTVTVK